jgi:predicted nucleic-acid-binding protein
MKGSDTNVLVRYLTRDDAGQERAASRFLDSATRRGEPIFVNLIGLCELVRVLGRTYEYARA